MSDAELNWSVLREILTEDQARYKRILASRTDWHPCSVSRLEAMAEAFQMALDSMDTLVSSVPGAACDTITKAAQ